MKTIFLITLTVLSFCAFGISEHNYAEKWHRDVFPFFLNHVEQKSFQSKHGNLTIRYGVIRNHQSNGKTILILPGRREPYFKYAEVVYDLYPFGFDFVLLDHRGQGGSQREVETQVGHVKKFQDYVDDVLHLVEQELDRPLRKELYLLAHSMGATIGAMAMERKPELWQRAVLAAPMLKITTKPIPYGLAQGYVAILSAFGKGEHYVRGGSDLDLETPFSPEALTQSPARFAMNLELFKDNPQFLLGDASNGWTINSMKATNRFQLRYGKVTTPILLLQADEDIVVQPKRQNRFCRKATQCRLVSFNSAHHEILMEKDVIRDRALEHIIHFFLNID